MGSIGSAWLFGTFERLNDSNTNLSKTNAEGRAGETPLCQSPFDY